MQAFFESLSGGGEMISLQSISESLRNLHQVLRPHFSEADQLRTPIITGNHKFNFMLHFERRSDVEGLTQTGVVVASGTTSNGQALHLHCCWKRRLGARLVTIEGVNQNLYHASADDVGAEIVCQAEAIGAPDLGCATGVLGPFEVDPITKMNLQGWINSGYSSFPARRLRDVHDPHNRDLQIQVTQDQVKVVHPGADRGNAEDTALYTADYPKVKLDPVDTSKFTLEMDPERKYVFQALSRTSRDLIVLLIRCFHARRYVATTFVLSRLFQNPATPGVPLTMCEAQDFDVMGLGQRVAKELDRTVSQLEVVEKVARNANLEKRELQAQLRETIASYTEAIDQLQRQLGTAEGSASTITQLQLHEARSCQSRLQLELQELRQQHEDLESHRPAGESGPAQLESLKSEIQQLRARISSLQGDQHDQSKRDFARQEELRRLRADVEMLSGEKEALETNSIQADKEKAELIENFVYVKGCLDDLQLASLSTPAASPEHERRVAQIKATYSQVIEERNRLAQKVDALDRERETQKHQREAALERSMNANARLLEERDRLEAERVRLSRLYERTVGSLSSSLAGPGTRKVAPAEDDDGPCDQAAMDALTMELERVSADLSKAEEEGNSLRSRLRRLAFVS